MTQKMNIEQADREAHRRWGINAMVEFRADAWTGAERETMPSYSEMKKDPKLRREAWKHATRKCSVGVRDDIVLPMFIVKGQGDTWEQAFADADDTEARLYRQTAQSGGSKG